MNLFNIERSLMQMKERKWPHIFWAIDLHDTIIEGKYNLFNEGAHLFPGAFEVLYELSRPNSIHRTILWTSSHTDPVEKIRKQFQVGYGITFNYINENPECPNTELCDFSKKFYFNILLDDKAGFVGETDWHLVKHELVRLKHWGTVTK